MHYITLHAITNHFILNHIPSHHNLGHDHHLDHTSFLRELEYKSVEDLEDIEGGRSSDNAY